MRSIVVVGSMAFDTLETPFGKADKVWGGSATYFSLAASYFSSVQCVSVVGDDFPAQNLELLSKKGVDVTGIQHAAGKTFHWAGRYGWDLNEAQTLSTALNVFESFRPNLPNAYKKSPFVFLGNIDPELQVGVLSQIEKPEFIALDTMNFWIQSKKPALVDAIRRVHALIINEGEIRQLTERRNLVDAAKVVQAWGPTIVVVKRGEYGAMLFAGSKLFAIPALPLQEVKDPTGAGDSFAGGFVGYLASLPKLDVSEPTLRKAVVQGCVMASFTVQDFGPQRLIDISKQSLSARLDEFVQLTRFEH